MARFTGAEGGSKELDVGKGWPPDDQTALDSARHGHTTLRVPSKARSGTHFGRAPRQQRAGRRRAIRSRDRLVVGAAW
jgi:hypothetical protein